MTKLIYTFSSSAVPESAHVVGFRGVEGISELYHFEVALSVRNDEELDLDQAVGFKAALTLETPDGPETYHGMIAQVELLHASADHTLYRVLLVPKAWFLTTTRHSWVFVDKDTPTILGIMLDGAGLAGDDYELRLHGTYPAREFVCQYKESDFDFVSRWMEREGIYFFFEQGSDKEKLIVTDDKSVHQPSRGKAARYVPLSGSDSMALEAFESFTCTRTGLPSAVYENDFDYLKPTLDVSGNAPADERGGGTVYRHGDNVATPDAAAGLARVRAEELLARQSVYHGSGRVFGLRAGYRFALDEHPRAALNADYLAVSVEHQGNQSAGSAPLKRLLRLDYDDEYHAGVVAIPAERQYRAARTTPKPRIHGYERGFVDGPADSDYAQLDEHGRYKVLLHFDESAGDTEAGKSSCWVRMMQPHGGAPEGFHLPLRKATEVMVSFLGGDPDRPLISGVVPNAMTPSPVTKDNQTQNVIQTGGKNRIEMEDQEGKQYVDVSTPPKNTFSHYGEPHGAHSHYIVLHTEGDCLFEVGGTRDIEIGGEQNEHVAGDVNESFDANQTTTIAANHTLDVGGNQAVDIGGSHTLDVGGEQVIDIGGTLSETTAGDVSEVYGGSQATDVSASLGLKTGGPARYIYGGPLTTTVSGAHTFTASGAENVTVGGAATHNYGAAVTQVIGGAYTTMAAGPIRMVAPSITLLQPVGEATHGFWQTDVAAQTSKVGFSLSVTGISIAGVGASISGASLSVAAAGFALAVNGMQVTLAGIDAGTYALKKIGAALTVVD
ncbi:MAG: type VI secretion system tip protein VgrG [Myxococcales bacterium]|nr:type VI secretion system tip protein VgrG [Myxococcales bacterium]